MDVINAYSKGGTKEIFLCQKLELLLKLMAASVPEVEVHNVTVVDGNNGTTVPKVTAFVEQLRQATGIDLAKIASNLAASETVNNGIVEQSFIPR